MKHSQSFTYIFAQTKVTYQKQVKLGQDDPEAQLSEDGRLYHPAMLSLPPASYGINPNDRDKTYEVCTYPLVCYSSGEPHIFNR